MEGRTLTTRAVVIATGSRPWLPPIPGLDAVEPLTCDTLLQLHERPERLLILGGGQAPASSPSSFSAWVPGSP